jgi:L-amino acid N-acyltransferase YncA
LTSTQPVRGLQDQTPVERIVVRDTELRDAVELSDLLNAIIVKGGTTAHEAVFTPELFADTYLRGPNVHCCVVAVDRSHGRLDGFQVLVRNPDLPDTVGDIGTFVRIGAQTSGIGSKLFSETCKRARELGLTGLNATIRSDNTGGLAYYRSRGFEDYAVTAAEPLKDGRVVDRRHKRLHLSQ